MLCNYARFAFLPELSISQDYMGKFGDGFGIHHSRGVRDAALQQQHDSSTHTPRVQILVFRMMSSFTTLQNFIYSYNTCCFFLHWSLDVIGHWATDNFIAGSEGSCGLLQIHAVRGQEAACLTLGHDDKNT